MSLNVIVNFQENNVSNNSEEVAQFSAAVNYMIIKMEGITKCGEKRNENEISCGSTSRVNENLRKSLGFHFRSNAGCIFGMQIRIKLSYLV